MTPSDLTPIHEHVGRELSVPHEGLYRAMRRFLYSSRLIFSTAKDGPPHGYCFRLYTSGLEASGAANWSS